tara:strand:+ start:822 stop:1292 length:471 start_codon:yes stop_codon:yes gene_type:complete
MVLGLFKNRKKLKTEKQISELKSKLTRRGQGGAGQRNRNIKKQIAELDGSAEAARKKKEERAATIEKARERDRKRNRGRGSGIKNRSSSNSTSKSTTKTKTKKVGAIEKQNRANLGDKTVDRLKSKNTDYQSYKKGKMTKAQFIKKYPNSNLAKGR